MVSYIRNVSLPESLEVMSMRFHILSLLFVILFAVSCADSGNPSAPGVDNSPTLDLKDTPAAGTVHSLWGLWTFIVDPDSGTVDIVPLRTADVHINILPILEPPANTKLSGSNISFDPPVLSVDLSIEHPFPGYSEFSAFDMAGIIITNGSVSGFSDPALVMAGEGDSRLLNPDCYTRWWNPAEFENTGKVLGYTDGLLGTPDSVADYNCTLNGCRFFANDLNIITDIDDLDPTNRLFFKDGYVNSRHYDIDLSGGPIFNYAVDVCWELPNGDAPYSEDDFPPEANRAEAWNISIKETENTLWNINSSGGACGGNLSLKIDVWDHYNAGQNSVWMECPGVFPPTNATLIGEGVGYATYEVSIVGATPKPNSINMLIVVESEVVGYWNHLPNEALSAYFVHTSEVSLDQPGKSPVAVLKATTPTTIPEGGAVSFDASGSTGDEPMEYHYDFNGDGIYDGPDDINLGDPIYPMAVFYESGTFPVTLKVINPWGEDISDPVIVIVAGSVEDIYVDADYTGGDSDGSIFAPFTNLIDATMAITPGHTIHVDYFDTGDNESLYYTDGLIIPSDITLLGDNWNGGGPGKPRLKNTSNGTTIGINSSPINNVTIEGFEIVIPDVPGDNTNIGISIGKSGTTMDNITIRHNWFTGDIDDTDNNGGIGIPMNLSYLTNSVVEFNEIGPIYWHSEAQSIVSRVLWSGMYVQDCENIQIRNNFIHDTLMDYPSSDANLRCFGIHTYKCNPAYVHNNLICHVKGINGGDYRIEAMMMEGYSGDQEYHLYNNTIDNFDHSESMSNTSLRGIFIYTDQATDTEINNTLMTYFYPKNPGSIQAYFSSPADLYPVTYSTGYNLGSITNYFYNLIIGDGVVNFPGIDPMYVNNLIEPYDYTFLPGSGCEMGDPNFLDWDDIGTPSGDPDEPDPNNRSRMGCFGGPDGNWDPNDL